MANTVNLHFDVIRQRVKRTDTEKVASGAIQTMVANFNFDDAWRGLYAYCRFEGAGGIKDVRIIDNKCVIPWEVLEAPGFKMACYGTEASDMMLTTEKIWVKVYQSINFMADDALPRDETPSLLNQYEAIIEQAKADQERNNADQSANNSRTESMVNEVEGIVMNNLTPTITNATKATSAANTAADRANRAVTDLESGTIPVLTAQQIHEILD